MNEVEKLARERCGACEHPGLNRTHTHSEFMAGYLKGIDDGERAQCSKCYNRGFADGVEDCNPISTTRNEAQAMQVAPHPDGSGVSVKNITLQAQDDKQKKE